MKVCILSSSEYEYKQVSNKRLSPILTSVSRDLAQLGHNISHVSIKKKPTISYLICSKVSLDLLLTIIFAAPSIITKITFICVRMRWRELFFIRVKDNYLFARWLIVLALLKFFRKPDLVVSIYINPCMARAASLLKMTTLEVQHGYSSEKKRSTSHYKERHLYNPNYFLAWDYYSMIDMKILLGPSLKSVVYGTPWISTPSKEPNIDIDAFHLVLGYGTTKSASISIDEAIPSWLVDSLLNLGFRTVFIRYHPSTVALKVFRQIRLSIMEKLKSFKVNEVFPSKSTLLDTVFESYLTISHSSAALLELSNYGLNNMFYYAPYESLLESKVLHRSVANKSVLHLSKENIFKIIPLTRSKNDFNCNYLAASLAYDKDAKVRLQILNQLLN